MYCKKSLIACLPFVLYRIQLSYLAFPFLTHIIIIDYSNNDTKETKKFRELINNAF